MLILRNLCGNDEHCHPVALKDDTSKTQMIRFPNSFSHFVAFPPFIHDSAS
jgi:hypothetical protein